MKRIVAVLVVLAIACQPAYCRSRYSKTKLILGFLLSTAGTLVAVDGFSMAKEDLSEPSYRIDGEPVFAATKDDGGALMPWWMVDASGKITNTGNVDFNSVTVTLSAYDGDRNPIDLGNTGSVTLVDVAQNQQRDWVIEKATSHEADGPQPMFVSYAVDYTYTAKERLKMKNPTMGAAGVAVAGVGLYLVIDAIRSANKVDYFLQQHDMDIRVAQKGLHQLGFVVSKRI